MLNHSNTLQYSQQRRLEDLNYWKYKIHLYKLMYIINTFN